MTSIGGILIAGGKSSRMGMDKAFLEFNGKPLFSYSLDLLAKICDEVIIVGQKEQFNTVNVTVIEDEIPNKGPLGGLYTGLKNSRSKINIILPCDVPWIHETVIDKLIAEMKDNDVVIAKTDDGLHPLVGIYHKRISESLLISLKEDRLKMLNAIGDLRVAHCYMNKDESKYLLNVNTKDDWSALNK